MAEAQQSFVIRRAEQSEGGLIRDLRFASLLSFEMAGDPLAWLRAFTAALPDVDPDLIREGRYFVADSGGELIAGATSSTASERDAGDEPAAHGSSGTSSAHELCRSPVSMATSGIRSLARKLVTRARAAG